MLGFLAGDHLGPPNGKTYFIRSPWLFNGLFQAIYALIPPTYLSPLSIASMALLQQANESISLSIGVYTDEMPSLIAICSQTKWLYDAINYQSTMSQGTEPFPHPTDRSYDAGMKISFR